MSEVTNICSNVSDQTNSKLDKIIKIGGYFNSELQERKIMNKKVRKYIAAFRYFDNSASASFSIMFFLATGIIKKFISTTRNKNKKQKNCYVA